MREADLSVTQLSGLIIGLLAVSAGMIYGAVLLLRAARYPSYYGPPPIHYAGQLSLLLLLLSAVPPAVACILWLNWYGARRGARGLPWK